MIYGIWLVAGLLKQRKQLAANVYKVKTTANGHMFISAHENILIMTVMGPI